MPLRTRTPAAAQGNSPKAAPAAATSTGSAKSAVAKKAAPAATKAAKATTPAKAAPAKAAAKVTPAPAKAAAAPVKDSAPAAKAAPIKAPAAAKAAPAKAAPVAAKTAVATKAPAKKAAAKATPTKSVPRAPYKPTPGGYATDDKFLASQKAALLEERVTYLEQATSLKAEAASLIEEMEPGDIQFDEESGEGGTVTVDRERDLALSNQALLAVEEIDAALVKIGNGRYGVCEGCGELIGKPRLEALPYARLCIACKSGGLSRR